MGRDVSIREVQDAIATLRAWVLSDWCRQESLVRAMADLIEAILCEPEEDEKRR